jgi:hypothetical protein
MRRVPTTSPATTAVLVESVQTLKVELSEAIQRLSATIDQTEQLISIHVDAKAERKP